jgi:hypothetical protein
LPPVAAVPPTKRPKGLLIGLIATGAVAVIAVVALILVLVLGGGDDSESNTDRRSGSDKSSSPAPTEVLVRHTFEDLAIAFELPEGWSPVEGETEVVATAPSGYGEVGVRYDSALSMSDIAADPEGFAAQIAEGAEAESYEVTETSLEEHSGDYPWQVVNLTIDTSDSWVMISTYTTDAEGGGAYLVYQFVFEASEDDEIGALFDLIWSFEITGVPTVVEDTPAPPTPGPTATPTTPPPPQKTFCQAWNDFLKAGGAYDPNSFVPITSAEISRWSTLSSYAPAAIDGTFAAILENLYYMSNGDYSGGDKYFADVADVEGYVKANCS